MVSNVEQSKRPHLLLSFVVGSLPWILMIVMSAFIMTLLGGEPRGDMVINLSLIGFFGGALNARHTHITQIEDRSLQLLAVLPFFAAAVVGPLTTLFLGTDNNQELLSSPTFWATGFICAVGINSYIVLVRVLRNSL